MKLRNLAAALVSLVVVSCGPPPTPWERFSTGECVDVYLAYEVDEPGPYCPHPRHWPVDEYVTQPTEGRPARVFACACI